MKSRSLVTPLSRYLSCIILLCLICYKHAAAQVNADSVYKRLQQRYGYVQAFGRGYILKANAVYGFADATGRLVLPFDYDKIVPVFSRRLIASRYNQYYIIDDNGHIISQSSTQL